jgi:MFS family permease
MSERDGAARRVPFLMIAAFFFVFLGPAAIQLYIKNVAPASWSSMQVTSILAVLYFSFMFWRFLIVPSQHLFGDKWTLALGAVGYVVVPVALLFTANYVALLAVTLLWGWAAAALWQTGPVWLYDNTDPRRRGLWTGVLYSLVFAGYYAGVRMLGYAAKMNNPRLILILAILPGALAFACAAMLPKRKARAQKLSLSATLHMLFDRRVCIMGFLLFMSATSYGLLLGSFRDKIQSSYGAEAVGVIVGYSLIVRMAVSGIGGHFGDVLARRTVVATVFLVGGVTLAAATRLEEFWAFSLASACLGLVGCTAPVSATAYCADWFEPQKRSLAMAASFFWQDCGMVVSLLGGQYIAQISGGFRAPFLVFAGLFLFSAAVAFVLPGGAGATEAATVAEE